jgi:3-hydroxy acid dehydrogenase / malonic semialdehyde reductase
MKRTALITGATSGFGEATARLLAAEGWRVIITGRRLERLNTLQHAITEQHGDVVHALHFDVTQQPEVAKAIASLPDTWKAIDVLVNNAGLAAGQEPLPEGRLDDWERMIDTNVKGLLYVSQAVIPGMIARGRGHIVNLGSVAGKEVYAKGAVYCASKHAVDALTKGMRIDLLPHGIKVTQIAPGAAETEFATVRFHGDAERAKQVYQGFEPLHPEDIAELVRYVISLPAHMCINDLVVTPTAQANSYLFLRK